MASSSRDIELVVRARDEATKAIQGVSDALKTLATAQENAGATAQKTDGLLGQLGTSLDNLKNQAQGLQALGVVATQLDKAGAAVARMEATAASSGQALDQLRAKQAELAATEQQLTARKQEATTALKAEEAAIKATERQIDGLDVQIKKASEGFSGLVRRLKNSKDASDELRASYRDQLAALMPLVEKQAVAEQRLAAQKKAAGDLDKELTALGAQYDKVSGAQKTVAGDLDRANLAFERSSKSLADAKAALGEMQTVAQQAAAALGGVEVKHAAITQAAKSTAESITAVQDALKRQTTTAAPTTGETPTPGGAAGKRAELEAQKAALDNAAKAHKEAQLAVGALSKEIKDSGQATAQQAAALAIAKQNVIETKAAFEAQQAALTKLRAETRAYVAEEEKARLARIQSKEAARAAAQAEKEAADAAAQAGAAVNEQASLMRRLSDAFRNLRGEIAAHAAASKDAEGAQAAHAAASNSAVSTLSHLRNTVMGLAAAYVGLHAAMRQIESVVETFRELETAQAKIAAAFDGNTKAAAVEMQYLRGEAERLGYSYAMLAEKYGKLALAGAGRNYSVGVTRELFTSIVEGARVAGTSVENLDRVLFDFVKMIDLGKMDARDFNGVLRQIPGAQAAIEKALNIEGDAHLFHKMQRSTDGVALTEKALMGFAKALREHFKDELPAVLNTFHAQWGRFQTTLEETRQLVGSSGFMEALTAGIVKLNDSLKSEEGQRFFQSIGHALGNFVTVLSKAIDHAGLLLTVFKGYVSLKLGQFFVALVPAVMEFVAGINAAIAAATLLDVALAGLPIIVGGIVFAMSGTFTDLITGISGADKALDDHARSMEKLKKAYGEAGGSIDDLKKKLSDLSLMELQADEQKLKREMEVARENIKPPVDAFGVDTKGTVAKIRNLVAEFKAGGMTLAEFKHQLDEIGKADETLNRNLARDLGDTAEKFDKLRTAVEQNAAAQRNLTGTATDADKATLGLANAMERFGHAMPTHAVNEFSAALNDMKKAIPELAKEAEYAAAKAKILMDYKKAEIEAGDNKDAKAEAERIRDRALSHLAGTYQIERAQGDRNQAIFDASSPLGEDVKSFLSARGSGSQAFHVEGVNSTFAERLAHALRAAEAATGERARINELVRDRETQAKYYDDYINGRGGLAAPPGRSRHERGSAADIPRGKVLDWLHEHADEFGLEFLKGDLFARDPVHIQLKRGASAPAVEESSAERFVDAVLARAGVRGAGAKEPLDFAKYGTEVKAEDRQRGDIVVVKTGSGYRVGFYAGVEDDKVKLRTGAGKEELFSDSEIAAIRRAPTKQSEAKQEITDRDAQAKFEQNITDAILKATEEAKALGKSPRDLFVQQQLEIFDKRAADSKVAPGQSELTFTKENREKLAGAAGALFDAKTLDSETKKLAEIKKTYDEIFDTRHKTSAVEEAINALTAKGFHFTNGKADTKEGQQALELETKITEQKQKQHDLSQLSGLSEQLKTAKQALATAYKEGDVDGIREQQAEIKRLNAAIREGLPAAMAYFKSINDQKSIATLEKVEKNIHNVNTSLISAKEVNTMFASGLTGVFDKLAEGLAGIINHTMTWKEAMGSLRDAFLQFAANFLKKIAEMIIQAQILKLLNATGFGSMVSGGVGLIGMLHSGGVVSTPNVMHPVSPEVFAGAVRYHTGGIAGLQPNEVPTILQKGEEVLTRADPRNVLNGGKSGGDSSSSPTNIKVINAIDAGHMMSEGLNTVKGQKVLMNFIRSNARAVNSALKG